MIIQGIKGKGMSSPFVGHKTHRPPKSGVAQNPDCQGTQQMMLNSWAPEVYANRDKIILYSPNLIRREIPKSVKNI